MARSNSPLLENTSGRIGDSLIAKQYRYGTVISKMPRQTKREKSRRQKLRSDWFAEAVRYAKSIICNHEKKAAYAATLPPDKLVYHSAMKEYLAEKKRVYYLPPGEEMRLMFGDGESVCVTNHSVSCKAKIGIISKNASEKVLFVDQQKWNVY